MATFTVALESLECASCRMSFGIPVTFMADRRRDHDTFYCPRGHSNYFPGKSEEEKLREQLKAARELAERESRRRRYADERADHAEASRAAYRGHVTRLKKRVAAGLCPYCSQSFPDLAAHVHDYHGQPDG